MALAREDDVINACTHGYALAVLSGTLADPVSPVTGEGEGVEGLP